MNVILIMTKEYESYIKQHLNQCLTATDFPWPKYQGKVRDTYDLGDQLLIVTTDRLSAFDRHIVNIPYKSQVLNQISAWWFEQTKKIIPNHLIETPDPTTMLVKKCQVIPIEVVVREYITGTTDTSLWMRYSSGERHFDDHQLPNDLQKNQQLKEPIITPTTKAHDHDQAITTKEIIQQNIVSTNEWEFIQNKALELYHYGREQAAAQGLILVDTKYEFGKTEQNEILLIDEIHTPDSSRYWRASNYQERFLQHQEPDNFDKEIIRLWYRSHCDPYRTETLPQAPTSLITQVASRYIELYETITQKTFDFPDPNLVIHERIKHNIQSLLKPK